MIIGLKATGDIDLRSAYIQNTYEKRHQSNLVGAYLAITIITSGIIIDWIYYREYFEQFLAIRLLANMLLVFMVVMHKKEIAKKKWLPLYTFALASIINVIVGIFVWIADGALSPYYGGIILCMVGVAFVAMVSLVETIVYIVFSIAIYLTGVFAHGVEQQHMLILYSNIFFLVAVGGMCVFATYIIARTHYENFSLNYQNYEKSKQLKLYQSQLIAREKSKTINYIAKGMAHEILNPISYSLNAIEALSKTSVDERQREMLADSREGMVRIVDIIEGLREFVQSGESCEEIDVHNVIERAIKFNEHQLKGVSVNNNVPKGIAVRMSKSGMMQTLTNLISNSVSFMREDPTIVIDAIGFKNDNFTFLFKDNGPGIKTPEHVFEPFYSNREGKSESMGLGLSIVRDIMLKYGGNIECVESTLGDGAIFMITCKTVSKTS